MRRGRSIGPPELAAELVRLKVDIIVVALPLRRSHHEMLPFFAAVGEHLPVSVLPGSEAVK
jgi:hypothetical protein